MKSLLALASALFLFGCSVSVTSGPTSQAIPDPADPSYMQLKTSAGYRTLSISSVTAVDVEITSWRGNAVQISRHFEGIYAQAVLQSLQLHAPQESGLPSSLRTGKITVQANSGVVANRTLWILNERMVEDSEFPEALYTAKTALNPDWLMALPQQIVFYNLVNCLYESDANSSKGKWQSKSVFGNGNMRLNKDEANQVGATLTSARTGYCNLVTGTGRAESLAVSLLTASAYDNLMMSRPCRFSGDGLNIARNEKILGVGEMVYSDFVINGVMNRNLVYMATADEAEATGWAEAACRRIGNLLNQ